METVTVNISFKKELLDRIDKAARLDSRNRSDFIREAARDYMDRMRSVKKDKTAGRIGAEAEGIAERAVRYDADGRRYTYADYLTWADDERWELIDGVPYDMSPAPSVRHQSILTALLSEFYVYLKGKPCIVLAAPLDVRFPKREDTPDHEIRDVVQPDLLVVCNRKKLDEKGCKAAPELIIEILSPSTCRKDVTVKKKLYEREGVKEYWIIRPDEESVAVYLPEDDRRYGRPDVFTADDKVKVGIFNGNLVIDLKEIFEET